jgi:hypothetical protein
MPRLDAILITGGKDERDGPLQQPIGDWRRHLTVEFEIDYGESTSG